ncbi:hypothetical protein BS50DRAFT_579477 [Corynespora cassiicola Philippines]|uniref:Pentatricopeptide repeat domain-containing protein n=1 Tax=Corynespora cassiicola Philippines TaxID=1448308 RepID=A0A2T2N3L4_CORCC|nr:hypothetical protein BS50DRAFT_579477 [Corynespora cassiicola Philippines]
MPSALDRLLASPSALRLLRAIVNAPDLPPACAPAFNCCSANPPRHHYSSNSGARKLTYSPLKWKPGQRTSFVPKNIPQPAQKLDATAATDNTLGNIDGQSPAAIWAKSLQLSERIHGKPGVREVWYARQGYNLPTDDTQDAAYLWRTFLEHPDLVVPVIDHAAKVLAETGQIHPRLYELCMTYWLPRVKTARFKERVLNWHHRFLFKLKLRKLPLCQIATLAGRYFTPYSYDVFKEIYRTSNEKDLYNMVVPRLCDEGRIAEAREWHALFLARRDIPSDAMSPHSLLSAQTPIHTEDHSEPLGPDLAIRTVKPKFNEELLKRLRGQEVAPVRFNDTFCAKMFATRAFPPESVIQGLAMLGVNELGPQALRTMALRTEPLQDLPKNLDVLKSAGIALKGCVFSVALEKFARDGNWTLVRSILDSDQHPDVFGDEDIQKQLLNFYLRERDWTQARRTLAVLSLFHRDANGEAWNLLLQAHVRARNFDQMMQVLQEMRTNRVLVVTESILMVKGLLSPRKPRHRPASPNQERFDDLRFVARTFIHMLELGVAQIPVDAWREILRRFGMTGRLRELKRLIYWLLCWYAPRNGGKFDHLPKSPFLDFATERLRATDSHGIKYFNIPGTKPQTSKIHPIRQLFPGSFQQGLIVWGFRAGILPLATREQHILAPIPAKRHYRRRWLQQGLLGRLSWTVGLRIVVQLRDLGVHVHRDTVIKALQSQFIVLFSPRQSRIKQNNLVKVSNTEEYVHYARRANEIWGEQLFALPETTQQWQVPNFVWHPSLDRRIRTRGHVRLSEILGPGWKGQDGEVGTESEHRHRGVDADCVYEEVNNPFDAPTHLESGISPRNGPAGFKCA